MNAEASTVPLFPAPHWFPHAADPIQDRVLLVRRTEAELEAASFLDDRSLTAGSARTLISWSQLAAAVPREARRDLQLIFHIGHVGSTLLSRLLGELPGALSLREPLVLRTLHEVAMLAGRPEAPWDPDTIPERFGVVQALLSRTFDPTDRVIVKATSFTSDIAPKLVPSGSAALLIYVPPAAYLENILAGDASRQEFQQLAGPRLARLARRIGEPPARLWEMREGERAALGWACEMASMVNAAGSLGRPLWCDFDRFLADPEPELVAIARHFGHQLDEESASRLCGGPIMSRYSKAPEHEYSPRLRQDVLAQSRARNGAAIRDGMAWLAHMGARYSLIGQALEQAG